MKTNGIIKVYFSWRTPKRQKVCWHLIGHAAMAQAEFIWILTGWPFTLPLLSAVVVSNTKRFKLIKVFLSFLLWHFVCWFGNLQPVLLLLAMLTQICEPKPFAENPIIYHSFCLYCVKGTMPGALRIFMLLKNFSCYHFCTLGMWRAETLLAHQTSTGSFLQNHNDKAFFLIRRSRVLWWSVLYSEPSLSAGVPFQ